MNDTPNGVYRIRIIDGTDVWSEDFADETAYHARLQELRCQLREQTYLRVAPESSDYSALADMSQQHKV